jgi:hypothetical protein
MQVGIVRQLPDGAEVTGAVASVFDAARSRGVRNATPNGATPDPTNAATGSPRKNRQNAVASRASGAKRGGYLSSAR